MIYLTGDIHGDKSRFQKTGRVRLKKGDTLLICGDFGFVWDGTKAEARALKWIGRRRYHVLFVDGSNENHKLLNNYPEEEAFGGKVRRISGRLCLMERGEVYEIEGKKIFAFGGGDSLERYSRREEEQFLLPSDGEIANGWHNLERCGNQVDLVVTHDAPAKVRRFIENGGIDEMTHLHAFLDEVREKVSFCQWYFGKYHCNKRIPPYFNILFTNIVKFEGKPKA